MKTKWLFSESYYKIYAVIYEIGTDKTTHRHKHHGVSFSGGRFKENLSQNVMTDTEFSLGHFYVFLCANVLSFL